MQPLADAMMAMQVHKLAVGMQLQVRGHDVMGHCVTCVTEHRLNYVELQASSALLRTCPSLHK
jgi:hypothetical protein